MNSRPLLGKRLVRAPMVRTRHWGLTPHDVLIASYPRSGSTWLRFLLYEALSSKPADFQTVNRYIPGPESKRTAAPLLPNGGRLIQTHDRFWPRGMKVIYLVRDVRDVLLSEYRAHKRNGVFSGSLDDYLELFLRGRVNFFGSWAQHVDFWIGGDGASSKRGERLMMTFEELRRRPQESVESAMGFLGAGIVGSAIAAAISNNSLESMKAREDAAPPGVIDHTVAGERFVGEGSAGGWVNKLTDGQLERIESTAGDRLVRCGYRLGR